jgi:triosephosphate isomerase (TIM)
MRTKIVAGNWKMNTTLADAHTLAVGVRDGVEHIERVETILCPPSVWLGLVAHDVIHPKQYGHLKLGAQNMYFEEKGAYTGEISPLMVKEVADTVILGHSERTHIFREDSELINHKVHAAFAHGLLPILCVGEDEQSATSKDVVLKELKKLIEGLSTEELDTLVVAYEPVWAIGTGLAATPEYAQEVIAYLRTILTDKTRILYGGSVTEENADGFLAKPDIDGFLIGGTSLKLKPFLTICQKADDASHN